LLICQLHCATTRKHIQDQKPIRCAAAEQTNSDRHCTAGPAHSLTGLGGLADVSPRGRRRGRYLLSSASSTPRHRRPHRVTDHHSRRCRTGRRLANWAMVWRDLVIPFHQAGGAALFGTPIARRLLGLSSLPGKSRPARPPVHQPIHPAGGRCFTRHHDALLEPASNADIGMRVTLRCDRG
jgi:hypothetical protein